MLPVYLPSVPSNKPKKKTKKLTLPLLTAAGQLGSSPVRMPPAASRPYPSACCRDEPRGHAPHLRRLRATPETLKTSGFAQPRSALLRSPRALHPRRRLLHEPRGPVPEAAAKEEPGTAKCTCKPLCSTDRAAAGRARRAP